jgi:hypothetical protein
MADPTRPTPAPAPAAPPAAPAKPATPAEALSSAHQVEELADRLSACADSIHARVMRDIHRYPGDVPASEQAVARALLEAEQELRQRANRLYADAAACIVSALGQPQQHVIRLTADAATRIQTITRIGDGVSLVARLLGLAAAAATGQATPILAALTALKGQLDVIALHNAPPAPPAAPPAA